MDEILIILASNNCFTAGWDPTGKIVIQGTYTQALVVDNDLNIYTINSNVPYVLQKWSPLAKQPVKLFEGRFKSNAIFYHILSSSLYFFNVSAGNPGVYKLLTIDENSIPMNVINANGHGSKLDQLGRTSHGLYVTLLGDIYLLDDENSRVVKWIVNARSGILVAEAKGIWSVTDNYWSLSSLFVDEINNILYIMDITHQHIIKYTNQSTDGLILFGNGPSKVLASPISEYVIPLSGTVDKMGNILVGEFNRIRKWTPDIKFNVIVIERNDKEFIGHSASLRLPTIMTFDKFDNLYVQDGGQSQMLKFMRNDTITCT